jgi:hypothetical protein
MSADPSAIEQAVSRTLRDNLERIQRTSEELHQAINDMVSACASSRATNALPPMIRAQSSASSLAAALDVLSRFVTGAMQSAARSPFEQEISRAASLISAELATATVQPEPPLAHPTRHDSWVAPAPVEQMPIAAEVPPAAQIPFAEPVFVSEPVPVYVHEPAPEARPVIPVPVEQHREPPQVHPVPAEAEHIFSLDSLPLEEQELHRRAYRVAKVSMQDIKMLRPADVQLGRENKDLCFRLRDDIEKAHKEYDRRFQSIHTHPVDYFYDWMVEILAGGDPQALGEYPYPSPVLRR